MSLNYQDTATFVRTESSGYGNNQEVVESSDVPVIFVQNTQFRRNNYQDGLDSDAVCWPDPTNTFIVNMANRLEGLYVLMPLYGAADDIAWFRVIDVTINRDHLISNQIDNIELRLKKTKPIPGVS